MKFFYALTLISSSFFSLTLAHESPWTAARPDGHAPISVMGDHMHKMGEWMVSYRYMTMDMEHLLRGSNSVTAVSQLTGMTSLVPTKMTMDMHMFGVMYAISKKWTLVGMLNHLESEMDMIMPMNMNMNMESSGIGDLKVVGLYDLAQWDNGRRMHLNLGLSVPTGSIDEKHTNGNTLGYGMQLGSGTYDFHPAVTYLAQNQHYSYGVQLGGSLRIGENDREYTLGDRFEVILWGGLKITESLSASVKSDYSSHNEVDGEDSRMMKVMSPSLSPSSQGRDITTIGFGLNYYFQDGGLSGHRLAAEWEAPVDQKVKGVQLEIESNWTLGWQYAW